MTKLQLLIDRLQSARWWTLSLLADIEDSEWFNMPDAGVGHFAWQIGHLASSQVALIHIRCCGMNYEDMLTADFRETFGKGSIPTPGPDGYPHLADIRSEFERIHADLIKRISSFSDSSRAR